MTVANFAVEYDDRVMDQAQTLARMPFVQPHVALMPDAHVGKGSSVGTVIPTVGAVIPAAVGVDIGCGMIAAKTCFHVDDWTPEELPKFLHALRLEIERLVPVSPGVYNQSMYSDDTVERINRLEDLWSDKGIDLSHSPKWKMQLGSLGGGNHFIELCTDELGNLWTTLHSGSRGVGNKIAQKHIKAAQKMCEKYWIELADPDLAYLVQGTPEFADYIKELNWAQQFALENRAEMMDRFQDSIANVLGIFEADERNAVEIHGSRINCHHNYTKMERHFGRDVWLTRKGAVDANVGVMAMIPGSMGTKSYIVSGKGHRGALCSAPHGAGRRFSRSEAKKRFTLADLEHRMEGIEYRAGEQFIDEIPDAYKDIDEVMAASSELVNVEHTLKQILNVKGE